MPVQTQIQVRRSTAATWTSTNPTLAAGEIGFETDTGKFKIGTGSSVWTALSYASNVSPLTTKGDLYTYSTDNTRLAVGSNGTYLVADSSQTTGLSYQNNFAAGKNKIINGDFNINQRNFSSTTTTNTYGFDRWRIDYDTGTLTYSTQNFTPGTAPVAGYEGKSFARLVTASQSSTTSYAAMTQRIEDVRTLAGQTATVSFWAKASTGTPNIGVTLAQGTGVGGSGDTINSASVKAITTSWARYSFTITLPSLTGKTIGTSSYLETWIFTSSGTGISGAGYPAVGAQNATIDIWGVQVEASSTATAFQTATGTIQGELAACMRYFTIANGLNGIARSTTALIVNGLLGINMRVSPSVSATAALNAQVPGIASVNQSSFATSNNYNNPEGLFFQLDNFSGLTTGQSYVVANPVTGSPSIRFSAEL